MNTDRAWRACGEQDPYFAVLSYDKFRSARIAAHKAEFMQTGEDQIAALAQELEERFGPCPRNSALEFGCGVGRLALPLANRFERVVGVDVSEAMLAEAGKNRGAAGVSNIEFVLSDDRLQNLRGTFDLIHSSLVLQHIPEARGMILIDGLLGLLNPGGVAALHFSLSHRFRFPKNFAYVLRHNVPCANAMLNLLQGEHPSRPPIWMSQYSLPAILELYRRHGIEAPVVQLSDDGDVSSAMLMGRRTASAPARETGRVSVRPNSAPVSEVAVNLTNVPNGPPSRSISKA